MSKKNNKAVKVIKIKAETIKEAEEKLADIDITDMKDGDRAEIILSDGRKLMFTLYSFWEAEKK